MKTRSTQRWVARVTATMIVMTMGVGCGVTDSRVDDRLEENRANREYWEGLRVSCYILKQSHFCSRCTALAAWVTMTVEDGAITLTYGEEGTIPLSTEDLSHYVTIEQMFDMIEDALLSPDHDVFNISYDQSYLYPTAFTVYALDHDSDNGGETVEYQSESLDVCGRVPSDNDPKRGRRIRQGDGDDLN